MAQVKCRVEEAFLENDDGFEVEAIVATCLRCEHVTESFGTSERSVKRCLVLMREECPRAEDKNFYVEE